MASTFFLAKPPAKLLPEALDPAGERELVDRATRDTVTRAIPGMLVYPVGGVLVALTTPILSDHPSIFIPLLAVNLIVALMRLLHARRFAERYARRPGESARWFALGVIVAALCWSAL